MPGPPPPDDGSATDVLGALFDADGQGGMSERLAAARVRAALLGEAERAPELARYRLRRVLGAGAMGQVWLADDPELSRAVAIKLVHAHAGEVGKAQTSRLAREARALARVSHPNVVQIFDVGTFGDGHDLFIAMEYVEGETLAQWSARRPPWREVIATFVQAAEGLHAAHAAGLMHRDFKPANVLLGRDGRVRVADFGLARTERSRTNDEAPRSEVEDVGITQGDALTADGTVVGTPLYMAPEQHAGTTVTARSDQYAFCVALYESLVGVRPFAGTLPELVRAKREGAIVEPPADARVPATIFAILRRGLAVRPEERWPSMAELADALRRAARPRRRGSMALAAVPLAIVVGLVAYDRSSPACAAGQIAWDAKMRGELGRVLSDGRLPEETTHVLAQLDDFANAWRRSARDACDGGSASQQLCVRAAAGQFDATVAALAEAPATPDERTQRAVESLPLVERCANVEDVGTVVVDERTLALRDEMASAVGLGRVAVVDEPVRRLTRVREGALELGEIGKAIATHERTRSALPITSRRGSTKRSLGSRSPTSRRRRSATMRLLCARRA